MADIFDELFVLLAAPAAGAHAIEAARDLTRRSFKLGWECFIAQSTHLVGGLPADRAHLLADAAAVFARHLCDRHAAALLQGRVPVPALVSAQARQAEEGFHQSIPEMLEGAGLLDPSRRAEVEADVISFIAGLSPDAVGNLTVGVDPEGGHVLIAGRPASRAAVARARSFRDLLRRSLLPPPPDPAQVTARLGVADVALAERLGQGPAGVLYRGRVGAAEAAIRVVPTSGAAESERLLAAVARTTPLAGTAGLPELLAARPFDGGILIARRYIDGESIAEILERIGRIDAAGVTEILAAVAYTLDRIQGAGLAHGAIHPRNVILTASGPSVVDLDLMGYPFAFRRGPYVAPELLESGPPEAADARFATSRAADMFGLGATIHRSAAGRPPGEGPPLSVLRRDLGIIGPVVDRLCHPDPRSRIAESAALIAFLGGGMPPGEVTFRRATPAAVTAPTPEALGALPAVRKGAPPEPGRRAPDGARPAPKAPPRPIMTGAPFRALGSEGESTPPPPGRPAAPAEVGAAEPPPPRREADDTASALEAASPDASGSFPIGGGASSAEHRVAGGSIERASLPTMEVETPGFEDRDADHPPWEIDPRELPKESREAMATIELAVPKDLALEEDDAKTDVRGEAVPAAAAPSDGEDLVGKNLGERYQVIARLGGGGMGVVYRARQTFMDRDVALKVLRPTLITNEEAVARFQREAKAAARIIHEHVVQTFDAGELDGRYYIAMEYVPGENMKTRIGRGALPPPQAVELVAQVLLAIQAAHQLGVVHRDLKAENVLVGKAPDGRDSCKVTDFGIARLHEHGDATGSNRFRTRAGLIIGTPEYMSPEQAAGDEVDHRSDLYSAGVILFEALAGRLPFTASTPMGYMGKHLAEIPPPVSERAPEGAGIPPALDEAVARALAKAPEDRFQSATEFLNALKLAFSDRPWWKLW